MGAKFRRRLAVGQANKRITHLEQSAHELLVSAFNRIHRLEVVLNALIAETNTQDKIKARLAAMKAEQEAAPVAVTAADVNGGPVAPDSKFTDDMAVEFSTRPTEAASQPEQGNA